MTTQTLTYTPEMDALRAESVYFDDVAMVAICDRAKAGDRDALRECANVIAEQDQANFEADQMDPDFCPYAAR